MKDQGHGSHWETVFDDEFPPNEVNWNYWDFDRILVQAWEAFRNRISEKDVLDRDSLSKKLSDIIKAKVVDDKVVDDKNVFIYTTVLSVNIMQRKIIVLEFRDGSEIIYNRAILFQFIKDKNELRRIYNDLQFLEELLLKDKYEDSVYFAVVNSGQSDKIFVHIFDIDESKDYYNGAFYLTMGTDRFADSDHNGRTDKKCQYNIVDANVRIPKYLLKKLIGKFCK